MLSAWPSTQSSTSNSRQLTRDYQPKDPMPSPPCPPMPRLRFSPRSLTGTCRSTTPGGYATRDGLVESIHYGSAIATAPERRGIRTLFSAGDPLAPFYPRSSLKPLQAVAMVSAGLSLPADLLALTAASHSGGAKHRDGTQRILEMHGLTADDLENSTDLPYGTSEREDWLRTGGTATQLTQNCSGKHAAMAATCVINGWPVRATLIPAPAAAACRRHRHGTHRRGTRRTSTDGCGTPLFALTLRGMARAFGRLASPQWLDDGDRPRKPGSRRRLAMRQHPDMVAGDRRDVTELMRLSPGLWRRTASKVCSWWACRTAAPWQ